MEQSKLKPIVESILFASGEPVPIARLAAALGVEREAVLEAAETLSGEYAGRGFRLVRLEESLQLCSAPEYSTYIRSVLETRKPPRLSPAALEALAIIAYFQPVTRAYIESVRGVDSSYTVSLLQERGLIEPCGTLDAPGRPTIFKTTSSFLRTFGISSLDELPPLPEQGESAQEAQLSFAIDELSKVNGEDGEG